MYRQFGNLVYRKGFLELGHDSATITQSGQLDALVALDIWAVQVELPVARAGGGSIRRVLTRRWSWSRGRRGG